MRSFYGCIKHTCKALRGDEEGVTDVASTVGGQMIVLLSEQRLIQQIVRTKAKPKQDLRMK